MIRSIMLLLLLNVTCFAQTGEQNQTPVTSDPRLQTAIENAFSDFTQVKKVRLYLTKVQQSQLEQAAQAKFDSRLITCYQGMLPDSVKAWLFYTSAIIRSQSATFTVLIDATGMIRETNIVAFHEPVDYRPPMRWLDLFKGLIYNRPFRLNDDIPVTTGATLSAQMFTREIRKITQVFGQLLKDKS